MAGEGAGRSGPVAQTSRCCRRPSRVAEKRASMPGLQEFKIGRSYVLFIVHPSNPVKSSTLEQVKDIFAGKIANWKDVGGATAPSCPWSRPPVVAAHAFVEGDERYGGCCSGPRLANGTQIPTIVRNRPPRSDCEDDRGTAGPRSSPPTTLQLLFCYEGARARASRSLSGRSRKSREIGRGREELPTRADRREADGCDGLAGARSP